MLQARCLWCQDKKSLHIFGLLLRNSHYFFLFGHTLNNHTTHFISCIARITHLSSTTGYRSRKFFLFWGLLLTTQAFQECPVAVCHIFPLERLIVLSSISSQ